MSRANLVKYGTFAVIMIVGVGLDQWTKWYASERLATYHRGYVEHPIELEVPESAAGDQLPSYLEREFAWNTSAEIDDMIARGQVVASDNRRLEDTSQLEAGQTIRVLNRKVTVVEDYWDFEYTENPGAAFGLLSDSDSPYRLPFFIVVSVVALGVILYILRDVHPEQKILVLALSMIGTGAVGNFIDRLRLGRVIDFVVWKVTTGGEVYRWPTFNVADSFISVGVVLMLIEVMRGNMDEPHEMAEADDTEG